MKRSQYEPESCFAALQVILISYLLATPVLAQMPEGISVQGYVEDDLGAPLAGSYSLTFNLYDDPSTGSALVTETKSLHLVNGVYNTVVFHSSAILEGLSFDVPYYLGVSVEGGDELAPRMVLSATPYALATRGFRAWDADYGYTIVAGDPTNSASPGISGATVSGGGGYVLESEGNSVEASWATVSGGAKNTASGEYNTIGGGTYNTTSGTAATVGGGLANSAGSYATVPGGEYNEASGPHSLAAGIRAIASNAGCFVWSSASSGTSDVFESTGVEQFLVRAPGGIGFGTNDPASPAVVHVEAADIAFDEAFAYEEELILEDDDVELSLYSGSGGPAGSTISFVDAPFGEPASSYTKWSITRRTSSTASNPNVLTFRYGSNKDYYQNPTRMWIGTDGHVHATSFDTPSGDVAEYFPVDGRSTSFEPGDVLAISTANPGAVVRSSEAFSTLVSGVYATAPGIQLGREEMPASKNIPMGLVGVVPTKVSGENGPIAVGDLLVSSSTSGCAMRADPTEIGPGMLLGKALDRFDGAGIAKIDVLLTLR